MADRFGPTAPSYHEPSAMSRDFATRSEPEQAAEKRRLQVKTENLKVRRTANKAQNWTFAFSLFSFNFRLLPFSATC
jgi:hypothetical protein